jgi:hypothetical protein
VGHAPALLRDGRHRQPRDGILRRGGRLLLRLGRDSGCRHGTDVWMGKQHVCAMLEDVCVYRMSTYHMLTHSPLYTPPLQIGPVQLRSLHSMRKVALASVLAVIFVILSIVITFAADGMCVCECVYVGVRQYVCVRVHVGIHMHVEVEEERV